MNQFYKKTCRIFNRQNKQELYSRERREREGRGEPLLTTVEETCCGFPLHDSPPPLLSLLTMQSLFSKQYVIVC